MAYNPNNPNGQATMANSSPVVIASDQSTLPVSVSGGATAANQTTANTSLNNIDTDLGAKADAAASTDTGTFSLIAFIKRGLQNWTTLQAKIPSLGQTTMSSSLPVTFASNQSNLLTTWDKTNYIQSAGNNSSSQLAASAIFPGSIESGLNHPNVIISLRADQPVTLTLKQYSDAAGTIAYPDTIYTLAANQGFNQTLTLAGSYYKVTVQNTGAGSTTNFFLETWLGILPLALNPTNKGNQPSAINEVNGSTLSLGATTSANSLPSSIATDDVMIGSRTETAPASDTASSGLNGRLQRVAQNITSLISKLPSALGQTSAANSLGVTLSNENVQDLYFTGQATLTGTVNNIIPSTASSSGTDLTGYRSGSVQIYCPTGTYTTGAIIFEGCNDSPTGSLWQTIPVYNNAGVVGAVTNTAITLASNTAIIYTFPINFRYIRVRISTGITGASASVQAFSKFSQTSWTPTTFQVAQNTSTSLVTSSIINGAIASAAAADATANPTGLGFRMFGHNYNGSTWDRPYNNTEVTLLASAARTTTQTSADIVCYNAKKLIVTLDMTVVGTGSVTVSIDGKDSTSGKYYNILTGAAITTNSTNRYRIGETLAAVANSVAQDYLPRVIRIVVTANNANSATYSVGYVLGL